LHCQQHPPAGFFPENPTVSWQFSFTNEIKTLFYIALHAFQYVVFFMCFIQLYNARTVSTTTIQQQE